MDPFSMTLAAISLATAVKDIVELGQKIHESFAKVSSNLRKARRIAKDIAEMVDKINIFYNDHKDALDNMVNFRMALLGLLDKFKNFASSILPLLPNTETRKLSHFIREWWNNNKIEGHLLDLQSDIIQVILEYTVKSSMRAEVKLETIHQDTSEGLINVQKDMTQGFEVIRRDISSLRATATTAMGCYSYESSGVTGNEFNRNIIMFAQSTSSASTPMLRSPDVITEEVATTVYIKVQINSIATIVEKILTMPQAILAPAQDNVTKFSWTPIVKEESMGVMHLRRHVVREVAGIRDLLDIERPQTISIGGITALNSLSVALDILCMPHEAILVGNWAVTLARALADTSCTKHWQPDLDAHLVFYLLNQSVESSNSGNQRQSLEAVTEAYTIIQNLRNQDIGGTVLQILHSKVLLHYASLAENQQSKKMCFEAIHVLEDILNVRVFTQPKLCNTNDERALQPCSSFLNCLFSSTSPKVAIVEYAYALEYMSAYLCVDSHFNGALDLRLHAVAVHRKLVDIHGDEWKAKLALALLSLVRDRAARFMPAEQLLDMTEECLQLLRELTGNNPPYYARKLINALWVKAKTLQNLNRGTEAITTWEEVADLARQIVQDSTLCAHALSQLSDQFRRLKKHEDAVRTGTLAITMYHENAETRALRYFHLSRDLWQLRRYTESVEAARTSVVLYRRLAMRSPGIWVHNLIESLSGLAHFLAALGNYSEALMAWKESVRMIDNFLDTHTGASLDVQVIDQCCATINLHQIISLTLQDKEESLQVCFTAVQHLRRLLETYPQDTGITNCLFWTEYFFAYSMLRFGRPQDAQQYVDHWLDKWRSISDTVSQSTMATWQAIMINLKVDIFDAQGCTEQALLTTLNVHDVVKPYVGTFQPCFASIIKSMHQESRLKSSLGDSGEALRIADRALQLARDNKLEPVINTLVRSLYRVASAALSHRNYNRAVKVAQEGCDILASPEGLKFGQNDEYWSFIRPSLFSILSSAEANLGRYSTALEYAHRAVNLSLDMKENKLYISSTTAEHSYIETRGNLAETLLVTGDFAQARKICEERSAYFSKRVETRMGEYRDLVPTLRMLGILCCSEGHHKEGEAAAQELSRHMKMLSSAFLSLQKQVKIRLRHQSMVPIFKVLDNMCQKLDCGHQDEVLSLFVN